MTRLEKMGVLVRCGFLAAVFFGFAFAQTATRQESISVSDTWPLAKAAEVIRARYGIPISYEDASTYSYYADKEDPVNFMAAHPGARVLPPKSSSLSFVLQPLDVSYDPARPADLKSVAKQLQGVLDQNQANGNPGRFRIMETSGGLVIVPTATRDVNGAFVEDHSILEARISFPEISGDSYLTFGAFRDALQAAIGKSVRMDILPGLSDPIRARNEPARDVLIRLLNGFHGGVGLMPTDGSTRIEPKRTWSLTTEPGIDPSVSTSYHLRFFGVVLERTNAKGEVVLRRAIAR
jgi:hypothetical protein